MSKSRIIEIRNADPAVFCFGLWRPKICISNGLIKILSEEELEAVLLHEYYHLTSREPLKLFVIKYFQNIFFFVPGIKVYVNKYLTFSELAADERATENFSDGSKLAQALLKISEAEERQIGRQGLALLFFSSVITERVNKLADNSYVPKFKLWGKGFLFGLCSLMFATMVAFVFLADSNKAFAMHNNGNCGLSSVINQNSGLICNQNSYQQICSQNNKNHPNAADCNMH